MMEGKAMYTFEEIIGNEQMIKQIQRAIQKNRFLMLILYMEQKAVEKHY